MPLPEYLLAYFCLMASVYSFSRDQLLGRHGLSARQVNALFETEGLVESRENKARELNKIAEFLRIGDLLQSHKINFIPLKGPILSYRIYGDATVRKYCDLDVLVEPVFVLKAKELLSGIGYEPVGYTLPENKTGQRIVLSHVHHILFTHNLHELRVELHWRLFQTPPVGISKLSGLVDRNLSEILFADRSFRVFNNELELLYLLLHGSIHNWRRLKWLTDVYELLNKDEIDWAKFNILANELRAGRLISLTNFMLSEYFPSGPSIPWKNEKTPFLNSYAIRKVSEPDEPEHETVEMKMSRLRFSLHSYPGLGYKLRRIGTAVIFYVYHLGGKSK